MYRLAIIGKLFHACTHGKATDDSDIRLIGRGRDVFAVLRETRL